MEASPRCGDLEDGFVTCAWSAWCAACVERSRLISVFALIACGLYVHLHYIDLVLYPVTVPFCKLICENRLQDPHYIYRKCPT